MTLNTLVVSLNRQKSFGGAFSIFRKQDGYLHS